MLGCGSSDWQVVRLLLEMARAGMARELRNPTHKL